MELHRIKPTPVNRFFVSADRQHIIVNAQSESAVLDLSGKAEQRLPGDFNYIAHNGEDRLLAFDGVESATVHLLDGEGRLLQSLLGHEGQIIRAKFSPNGDLLITLSRDSTARLWSAQTGELMAILPHQGIAWDAVFTPDGNRVFTASFDGWVRSWCVREDDLVERAKARAAVFEFTAAERERYRDVLR